MLPNDLREARKALGLTQAGLAKALRLSEKNGGRSIRIWEAEGNTVPGPVQVAVSYMLKELENAKRTGKILENTSANTRI
jgi:transcriptional regulator with XRE-family HTH domain